MLIIHVWHNQIWTIVLEFWTIQPLGSKQFFDKSWRGSNSCLNNLDILPPFCHNNLEITKIINLSYVWIVVLWLGWNFSLLCIRQNFHFCIWLIVNFMLISILSNIMIFNMPQCAGFDKVCAKKAVWSRSRWLDKWWKHFVPWPSFQYGLSLSLSPLMHAHTFRAF